MGGTWITVTSREQKRGKTQKAEDAILTENLGRCGRGSQAEEGKNKRDKKRHRRGQAGKFRGCQKKSVGGPGTWWQNKKSRGKGNGQNKKARVTDPRKHSLGREKGNERRRERSRNGEQKRRTPFIFVKRLRDT